MFFDFKHKKCLAQMLEQEKQIRRLQTRANELEDMHLRTLEKYLQLVEEIRGPKPEPDKEKATPVPIQRGNYPQDRGLPSLEVTESRLKEIFGEVGKKNGN